MLSLPDFQADMRTQFAADGYLPLPALMADDTLRLLRAELARLEAIATRRDFTMACMDDSPRHMTTLGGHILAEESPAISDLYQDPVLVAFLGQVSGLRAVPVKDPVERHVLNILHRQGDTHGAHTDDYPLALVLFLHAPEDPRAGGLLEYVPHGRHLHTLDTPRARRAHHRTGDGYVLRSDTTAHRVTPLRRPHVRRAVLNLAYTTPERQAPTTPSAPLLYS